MQLKSNLCLYQCSPSIGFCNATYGLTNLPFQCVLLTFYQHLLRILALSLSHTKYTTFIIFFDFLTNSLIRRPRSPLLSNRTPRASSSLYVSISSLSLSLSLSLFLLAASAAEKNMCQVFHQHHKASSKEFLL